MTLSHKIKLIFCRIIWWLGLTDKARKHYEIAQDYYYLYDLYNEISVRYLEADRKRKSVEDIHKLKGQVELLAGILDIKE